MSTGTRELAPPNPAGLHRRVAAVSAADSLPAQDHRQVLVLARIGVGAMVSSTSAASRSQSARRRQGHARGFLRRHRADAAALLSRSEVGRQAPAPQHRHGLRLRAEENNQPHIVMEFLRGCAAQLAHGGGAAADARRQARYRHAAVQRPRLRAQRGHRPSRRQARERVHAPGRPVKLLDFGIAKLATSTLTRQGDVVGSAPYMSPEQICRRPGHRRAHQPLDSPARSMYEMLTGSRRWTWGRTSHGVCCACSPTGADAGPPPQRQRARSGGGHLPQACSPRTRDDRYATPPRWRKRWRTTCWKSCWAWSPLPMDAAAVAAAAARAEPLRCRVSTFAATWRRRLVLTGMVLAVALGTAVWAGLPARWAEAYPASAGIRPASSGRTAHRLTADSLITQVRLHRSHAGRAPAALPRQRFRRWWMTQCGHESQSQRARGPLPASSTRAPAASSARAVASTRSSDTHSSCGWSP